MRCDIYLDAVEARTQGWLYELKSPRGTPLGEVFQEELGLDAQEQARFLVYREMIRASASTVPATESDVCRAPRGRGPRPQPGAWDRAGGFRKVGGYLGTSLLLCILFWPEAVPFGRAVGRTTAPAQVASYAASQDPGAEIMTAEDTGQVPDTLRDPTLLAPGFRLLLRAITETPWPWHGRLIRQSHRTFAQSPADAVAAGRRPDDRGDRGSCGLGP